MTKHKGFVMDGGGAGNISIRTSGEPLDGPRHTCGLSTPLNPRKRRRVPSMDSPVRDRPAILHRTFGWDAAYGPGAMIVPELVEFPQPEGAAMGHKSLDGQHGRLPCNRGGESPPNLPNATDTIMDMVEGIRRTQNG